MYQIRITPYHHIYRAISENLELGIINDYPIDLNHSFIEADINITDNDTDTMCASAHLTLFNSLKGKNMISHIISHYEDELSEKSIAPEIISMMFLTSDYMHIADNENHTWSGTLDTLYVDPSYRRKGLGSFIINNLQDIIGNIKEQGSSDGIQLACVITTPHPTLGPDTDEPDERDESWEAIRDFLFASNFSKVSSSDLYDGANEGCYLKSYIKDITDFE